MKNIKNLTNIKVIGAGSNILIRDCGFDGVIIKLGKSFTNLSLLDENTINGSKKRNSETVISGRKSKRNIPIAIRM